MTPDQRLIALEATTKALAEGFDHLRASLAALNQSLQTAQTPDSATIASHESRLARLSASQDDLSLRLAALQDALASTTDRFNAALVQLGDQIADLNHDMQRDRYEITRSTVIKVLRDLQTEAQP